MMEGDGYVDQHGKVDRVGEFRTGGIDPIEYDHAGWSALHLFGEHAVGAIRTYTRFKIEGMPESSFSSEQRFDCFAS